MEAVKKPTVEIPRRKFLFSCTKILDTDPAGHYCYDFDSDDPYTTDHFRIYEFKIRRCTRRRSHDWTDCPFAHPGEKARRRDPRLYRYSGDVCPEFRRHGGCSRGDDCDLAHGVFECWLHPSRYRTEACKDGKHCKRKVCFFAHSPRQLRVLPPGDASAGGSSSSLSPASVLCNKNRCCLFCHSIGGSPTSFSHISRSPSTSPPLSPANKAAAVSRLKTRSGTVTYNGVPKELMSSLETMSLTADFDLEQETNNHHHRHLQGGEEGYSDPDIEWVNDLLM